jgi:hypothetical protein
MILQFCLNWSEVLTQRVQVLMDIIGGEIWG